MEKFTQNTAQRMKRSVIKRPGQIERFQNPFKMLAKEENALTIFEIIFQI